MDPSRPLPQVRFGAPPWHRLRAVVRRHPLLVFGVPVLLLIGTLISLALLTPVYEASTSIRIDERRPNVAILEMLRTLSAGSQVDTEMEELRSRTLAESVVDSLDLDVRIRRPGRVFRGQLLAYLAARSDTLGAEYHFEAQGDGTFRVRGRYPIPRPPGSLVPFRRAVTRDLGQIRVGERRQIDRITLELAPEAEAHATLRIEQMPLHQAVEALQKRLSVVRPVREASMAVVGYEGEDPALVQAVPNLLAELFVARRRAVERTQAGTAVIYLAEQIDTVSRQLTATENELRNFRERNRVVSPEAEADAQIRRLIEMQAERDMLDAERVAFRRLMEEVETTRPAQGTEPSPYRRLLAFPTLLQHPAASELLRLLAEVENERSALLIRRTLDDPDVGVLMERIRELEEQLRQIARTYLSGLEAQVASLDAVLGRFQTEIDRIPAVDITFARFVREGRVLGEIYELLRTRLKEAEIAAAVEDVSLRIVDPAPYPREPARPRPLLSLALALVIGVVIGVGSAFARQYLDSSVRTREDLEYATGVPVLGLVPAVARRSWLRGRGERAPSPLLMADGGTPHPLAEPFRTLRTRLSLAWGAPASRALVVTSAVAGEGKSTTAVNLALVLADQGQQVLVVDGDLRRGNLHALLGGRREPGLAEVLAGETSVDEATQQISHGAGRTLALLPAGAAVADPAALLDSPAVAQALERMKAQYDCVIIDAPPLEQASDAAVLGKRAEGVVLVVRAGGADAPTLAQAMDQLVSARADVVGAVLNGVDPRSDRYPAVRSIGSTANTDGGRSRG